MNIVINLNKPKGISSQEAVNKVKKILKVKKAGHAGTLDPIATGVLLICLNEATKITPFLSNLDKEYIVTMKLGEKTDTYDSEGTIIEKSEIIDINKIDIEKAIKRFIGEIEQIPPMYSAIKYKGKPLYKLARKGIEVGRKPKKVLIRSIDILEFEPPFLKLRVACSKGTYIRSLCNDIGYALGVGAHMVGLLRTKVGKFFIEDSALLEDLPGKKEAQFSIDDALNFLPEIVLSIEQTKRAMHGNPIEIPGIKIKENTLVRLKNPETNIIGIGKIFRHSIKIERLFNM
jgi:tRNA pseudouridine55 synthase